jgi:hypothetical protein
MEDESLRIAIVSFVGLSIALPSYLTRNIPLGQLRGWKWCGLFILRLIWFGVLVGATVFAVMYFFAISTVLKRGM